MGGSLLYIHPWITYYAGRATFIACFIGVLINMPLFLWVIRIGSKNPNKTLFDILESCAGKVTERIFLILYLIISAIYASLLLNIINGIISVFFLRYTDYKALILMFILIGWLFSSKGLRVLGLFFIVAYTLAISGYYIGLIAGYIGEFQSKYLFPVFHNGIGNFVTAIIITAGGTAEGILALFIIIGAIEKYNVHKRLTIITVFIWSLAYVVPGIMLIGTTSAEVYMSSYNSGMEVFSSIRIGDFIRGIEVFVLFAYQVAFICRFSLYFYCIYYCINRLFNLKPFITGLISSLLIFLLSGSVASYNKSYFYIAFMNQFILLPFVFLILLYTSIAYSISRIRGNKSGEA